MLRQVGKQMSHYMPLSVLDMHTWRFFSALSAVLCNECCVPCVSEALLRMGKVNILD